VQLPEINIKDYDYPLDESRIAKYPLENRSDSKLLFWNKGEILHKKFTELPGLLPANTLLVFNTTKVIEARLLFKKLAGSTIEIFLLNPADHSNASTVLKSKNKSEWFCLVGNKKRWKEGDELILEKGDIILTAKWVDREKNLVEFTYPPNKSFLEVVHELGELPIPPYLNRPTETIDETRYQTKFAEHHGSVAAPTAALHFDEKIITELKSNGHTTETLTLHVGAGTFKPVTAENASEHVMHQEFIIFTLDAIEHIKDHPGPVVPVGTTSMRSLESLYWFGVGLINQTLKDFNIPQYFPYETEVTITKGDALHAVTSWMKEKNTNVLEGNSSIYILPGYKSKMVNGIITNFHQPQSTLLLLITSMVGDTWKTIYKEAMENNYRFLSYGDSSLILF